MSNKKENSESMKLDTICTLHFTIDLDYLDENVRSKKGLNVFKNSETGKWLNKKETLAEIERLKKRGFICMPIGDCDNYSAKGQCKGHKKKAVKA